MHMHISLWGVALIVFLVNLPFGFWRSGVKPFSRSWFFAVHLPVPIAVAVRLSAGIGWHLAAFPVLVGAFFLGQYLGGAIRHAWQPGSAHPPSETTPKSHLV